MNKIMENAEKLQEIVDIDVQEYDLAQAIIDGSKVTSKATNWNAGESACAMTAAVTASITAGQIQ